MLTPLDIKKKEFKKCFRGYDEKQVEAFIEEIALSFEELLKEKQAMEENLLEYKNRQEKYKELEEALKSTMIMAQKNAQDMKENTDQEIRLMMTDAHQRSERIIQEAEELGKNKIKEAEKEVNDIKLELRELQKQAQVFRLQFRNFLETQLDLLLAEGKKEKEEDAPEKQAG